MAIICTQVYSACLRFHLVQRVRPTALVGDSVRPARAFYKALKEAGLPQVRFHDLRHTFGDHGRREARPDSNITQVSRYRLAQFDGCR